jgi:phytoene dehydrogenase-like protein
MQTHSRNDAGRADLVTSPEPSPSSAVVATNACCPAAAPIPPEDRTEHKRTNRVLVIGAGPGGLATALLLAKAGIDVRVIERLPRVGGRCSAIEAQVPGGLVRFDLGPTILTVPSVFRRIFAEAGRKLEDYLDLIQLDPHWRCFFEGGSDLDLVENTDAMAKNLDSYAPGTNSAVGYKKF